jgi:putative membrane protein
MERALLFLKGVCMGVADIIPGVSGGTLALILGIYADLVNTIKGLHLKWIPGAAGWVRSGFDRTRGRALWEELRAMNLEFLLVLGAGIAVAIAAGSMVIPTLLERYPEAMRALFFGLILASVGVPLRMIPIGKRGAWVMILAMMIAGAVIGWIATAPHRMYQGGVEWVTVEAGDGETLKDLSRRGPSAWPGEAVYWAPENQELREILDERASTLGLAAPDPTASADRDALREREKIYETLAIPEGTPVQIPRPALWFVFIAGMIAICAMILPGISGSYLLLIMGAYFFLLNALKGVITGAMSLSIPGAAATFVVVFMIGAALGLLSFARVMSYLLRRFPAATLGMLVGLMLGCLRGIWPFRSIEAGRVVNALPASFDQTVVVALVAGVLGALVVLLLSRLGREHAAARMKERN